MTELLNIYDEIYKPQVEYCVICFRSANERRMVDLKNLEIFLKSINLPFKYHQKCQRVCWLCDRGAVAAYRLRFAANLSSSIHGLFSFMDRSKRRNDIAEQLKGYKRRSDMVNQAGSWQERLLEIRARTQLLNTEVLVVASVPPSHTQEMQMSEPSRSPSPQDESDVYLLPDASPPHRSPSPAPAPSACVDALTEPEIYMDSVIIEDDERDPIEIKREDPTDVMVSSHITSLRKISSRKPETPRVAKTPHVTNTFKTKVTAAPITSHAKNPSQTTCTPSIVPIEKLLDNADNTSFLLHPIVENNGVMSVPTLNARIINGQLMTVDSSNLILQTPQLALHNGVNLQLVTEPNQVTNFLKTMKKNDINNTSVISSMVQLNKLQNVQMQNVEDENANNASIASDRDMQTLMLGQPYSQQDIMTHSIIIEEDDDTEINCDTSTKVAGKRQNDGDGRKKRERDKQDDGPPKKQKETDWEDKIPMDVISYMDATDPNAMPELRREPALGFISDVHSVTEEAHSLFTDTKTNSARGVKSVQGIYNVQRLNNSQTGIFSVQPEMNNIKLLNNMLEINNVQNVNSEQRLNSIPSGINNNTVQPRINNIQLLNSVQGINNVQIGDSGNMLVAILDDYNNSLQSINNVCGINSVNTVTNSVLSNVNTGTNRVILGNSVQPAAKNVMTYSRTKKAAKGNQKLVEPSMDSVHQNVFSKTLTKQTDDVIDLC